MAVAVNVVEISQNLGWKKVSAQGGGGCWSPFFRAHVTGTPQRANGGGWRGGGGGREAAQHTWLKMIPTMC